MDARNADWNALNSARHWPVDDAATGVDDAGILLPTGIVADVRLRFPSNLGRYAFIGGVTVTKSLVTVVFAGSQSPAQPSSLASSGSPSFVPLAAITLPLPLVVGQSYSLSALAPGVGGWIVFGDAVDTPYSGRFSNVRQSQLLARCAAAYQPLPIESIAKKYSVAVLQDIVGVLAGQDIAVTAEAVTIGSDTVQGIVIKLADSLNRNVFALYSGPCAGRPETRSCPKPVVESIGTVTPDCNGNVEIDFRSLRAAPYVGGGGITLNVPIGLADACTTDLPGPDGKLPNTPVDLCGSSSGNSQESSTESSHPGPPPGSSVSIPCVRVPYCNSFDARDVTGWTVEDGTFGFESGSVIGPCGGTGSFSYAALTNSRRSTSIWSDWNNCQDDTSLEKRVIAAVMPQSGGTSSNAGVVINWHRVLPSNRPQYFLALVNATKNAYEIWFYNGQNIAQRVGVNLLLAQRVQPDQWYKIEVVTTPSVSAFHGVDLTCVFTGITNPSLPPVTIPLTVTDYGAADGVFGVGSIESQARFGYFDMDDA